MTWDVFYWGLVGIDAGGIKHWSSIVVLKNKRVMQLTSAISFLQVLSSFELCQNFQSVPWHLVWIFHQSLKANLTITWWIWNNVLIPKCTFFYQCFCKDPITDCKGSSSSSQKEFLVSVRVCHFISSQVFVSNVFFYKCERLWHVSEFINFVA